MKLSQTQQQVLALVRDCKQVWLQDNSVVGTNETGAYHFVKRGRPSLFKLVQQGLLVQHGHSFIQGSANGSISTERQRTLSFDARS